MKQRRILSRILFSIFLVLVILSACNNPSPTSSIIKGNADFNNIKGIANFNKSGFKTKENSCSNASGSGWSINGLSLKLQNSDEPGGQCGCSVATDVTATLSSPLIPNSTISFNGSAAIIVNYGGCVNFSIAPVSGTITVDANGSVSGIFDGTVYTTIPTSCFIVTSYLAFNAFYGGVICDVIPTPTPEPTPEPTPTPSPTPTPVCYPGTPIIGVHNLDGSQACCPEGANCGLGGGGSGGGGNGSPSNPPAPTPTAINISIAPTVNPSSIPSSPNPTNTPTSTPIATPTPKPTKTPTVKPTPEDDIMVGIDFPIVSTTESENDDNSMIARLDSYFDKAQKYALNNSYSTAAFSIQANGRKIDTNKYIRIIKEKFYSLVSSDENKPLKTYHQIKGKQVNMKHLVIIENLSNQSQEAVVEGELNIIHNNSSYAKRFFNHTELMFAHQTKKIVIQDPLLVWYGRDESKEYIDTNGDKGRFGPYLAENGIYTCTVTSTKVSPNFILKAPTDTPVYFNTFNIDSQYSDYTTNGVPKETRLEHIKERHMINFLTINQYQAISDKINQYAIDIKNIFQNNNLKNNIRKRDSTLNLKYNNLRAEIVTNDEYSTSIFTPKSSSCFPESFTSNDIEKAVKSVANFENINDSWSKFTDNLSEPRAIITGNREGINIETRIDNRTYGGYGTISTAYPATDKTLTESQRKDLVLLYYLNLVTNNTYSNDAGYLENNFSPHTTILLGLTTK